MVHNCYVKKKKRRFLHLHTLTMSQNTCREILMYNGGVLIEPPSARHVWFCFNCSSLPTLVMVDGLKENVCKISNIHLLCKCLLQSRIYSDIFLDFDCKCRNWQLWHINAANSEIASQLNYCLQFLLSFYIPTITAQMTKGERRLCG